MSKDYNLNVSTGKNPTFTSPGLCYPRKNADININNKNSSSSSLNTYSGLNILQWNCNGLLAHQNEFKNYLSVNKDKYDIICLQETFLKPGKHFTVPGYIIIRQDRIENNKGGVLTMIKKILKYVHCSTELHSRVDSPIEYIKVDVKLLNSRLKIVNMYIPPDKDFGDNDISFLFGNQTLIIGDLNAKSKLWGSPTPDRRGLMLKELIDRYDMLL